MTILEIIFLIVTIISLAWNFFNYTCIVDFRDENNKLRDRINSNKSVSNVHGLKIDRLKGSTTESERKLEIVKEKHNDLVEWFDILLDHLGLEGKVEQPDPESKRYLVHIEDKKKDPKSCSNENCPKDDVEDI